MIKREEVEIMAPAGSWESLAAAIQAGADSVYFGVEKLNMRSKSSSNFTMDDLRKIVNICKENKIRSYLTVNTILYDNDINLMRDIIRVAKDAGITKVAAKAALESFVANVTATLKKKDGKVALVGFGTFSVAERAARQGINPATKKPIKIAAKKVAKFKAGADLAAAVSGAKKK